MREAKVNKVIIQHIQFSLQLFLLVVTISSISKDDAEHFKGTSWHLLFV